MQSAIGECLRQPAVAPPRPAWRAQAPAPAPPSDATGEGRTRCRTGLRWPAAAPQSPTQTAGTARSLRTVRDQAAGVAGFGACPRQIGHRTIVIVEHHSVLQIGGSAGRQTFEHTFAILISFSLAFS